MSGGNAAIGENILRGIDFAVDEINKAGGVNGQMLEVVRGDHAGDAATGKYEAERLITQELHAKKEGEDRWRSLDETIRRQQSARKEAAAALDKRGKKKSKAHK